MRRSTWVSLLIAACSVTPPLVALRDPPTSEQGGQSEAEAERLGQAGTVLRERGQHEEALRLYVAAQAMNRRLTERSALAGSMSDALTRLAAFPDTRSALLSATRGLPDEAARTYRQLWESKAALARLFRSRRTIARTEQPEELRARLAELTAVQRRIGGLVVKPVPDEGDPRRDRELAELTEKQRMLEAEIACLTPQNWSAVLDPSDLAKALREGDVFIDLHRYEDLTAPAGQPRERYAAFVQAKGGDPRRADLGPAQVIDEAVRAWRKHLVAWNPTLPEKEKRAAEEQARAQAAKLRRLVWEPIAKQLPGDAKRLYISPDGDLHRLPFSALPGGKPDTVLLEAYAIAVVESGPFLLEQLQREPADPKGKVFLGVGGVRYDPPGVRAGKPWEYRKSTEAELILVMDSWGDRGQRLVAICHDATTDWVVRNLPEAHYAHLATHGQFRAEDYAKDKKRLAEATRDRIAGPAEVRPGPLGHSPITAGQGVRNPLGYVGMILANANRPAKGNPDRSILAGMSVWPLDLSRMELAVLSGSETALGEYTGGAGVQNMVLAFHVAGCRNVVASLWEVDDEATAALMAKFHQELWVNQKPIIEALREARLLVYRRPDLIPVLAGTHGIERAIEALRQPPVSENRPGWPNRTPPKYWAAFALSGAGR